MSLDGVWDGVVNSPMGLQKSTLTLKTQGGTVTGESDGGGASVPLLNGKIDGDKVSWSLDVTSPMKLKVNFEATLNGDTLEGVAKPGMFGKFAFTATRRA